MRNRKSGFTAAKAILGLVVVSAGLAGCNVDEKPSKMVEMRGQMMKQRQEMQSKYGHSAPSSGSTGQ